MILTGNEIKLQHEAGTIIIEPWDDARVNPNSYNVSGIHHYITREEAVRY